MRIRGKNVYLSGPMTGCDHNNVIAFMDAHELLNELGANRVYDPAYERYYEISRGELEHDHAYYMRRCVFELVHPSMNSEYKEPFYDVLVSLPGWQSSEGAKVEREVAAACDIPCVELGDCV